MDHETAVRICHSDLILSRILTLEERDNRLKERANRMSRRIIHDLVLPIILKRLQKLGIHIYRHQVINDKHLEEFFIERLAEALDVPGHFQDKSKQHEFCDDLEEKIIQARRRNWTEFQQLINKLLDEYIDLKEILLTAKKIEPPPDRFSEQRKKAEDIWRAV